MSETKKAPTLLLELLLVVPKGFNLSNIITGLQSLGMLQATA
jgi:hypothetical protein